MGKLARVLGYLRGVVTSDMGGGVLRTTERLGPPGIDAAPVTGDVVMVDNEKSLGVVTEGREALPGEIILTGRNAAGVAVSSIRMLSDGSVSIGNSTGQLTLTSSGKILINGVEIDLLGQVSATEFSTPLTSFNLHFHPDPVTGFTGTPVAS